MSIGMEVMRAKDQIHRHWLDVQMNKHTEEGEVYILKSAMDAIVTKGGEALALLEDVQSQMSTDEELDDLIGQVQHYLSNCKPDYWADEDDIMEGVDGQEYYITTPDQAGELVMTDINFLANKIHQAGYSLLGDAGEYCGCVIKASGDDIASINSGVMKYCQGTLKLDYPRGVILPPGDMVEHRPGGAQKHAFVASFEDAEGGYQTKVDYTESGDHNWRIRKQYLMDFLEGIGLECEKGKDENGLETLSLYCNGVLDERDILKMALVVSQLKDIDLLYHECISVAFEEVYSQAADLLDKYAGPEGDVESMWDGPWVRAGHNTTVNECSEGVRHRRAREYRREQRVHILDATIHEYLERTRRARALIAASEYAKCEKDVPHTEDLALMPAVPFRNLTEAHHDLELADCACAEITESPYADRYDGDCEAELQSASVDLQEAEMAVCKRCGIEETMAGVVSNPHYKNYDKYSSLWRVREVAERALLGATEEFADELGGFATAPVVFVKQMDELFEKYNSWVTLEALVIAKRQREERIASLNAQVETRVDIAREKRENALSSEFSQGYCWPRFYQLALADEQRRNMDKACGELKEVGAEEQAVNCWGVSGGMLREDRDAMAELLADCSVAQTVSELKIGVGNTRWNVTRRLNTLERLCWEMGDKYTAGEVAAARLALPPTAYMKLGQTRERSDWPLGEYNPDQKSLVTFGEYDSHYPGV